MSILCLYNWKFPTTHAKQMRNLYTSNNNASSLKTVLLSLLEGEHNNTSFYSNSARVFDRMYEYKSLSANLSAGTTPNSSHIDGCSTSVVSRSQSSLNIPKNSHDNCRNSTSEVVTGNPHLHDGLRLHQSTFGGNPDPVIHVVNKSSTGSTFDMIKSAIPAFISINVSTLYRNASINDTEHVQPVFSGNEILCTNSNSSSSVATSKFIHVKEPSIDLRGTGLKSSVPLSPFDLAKGKMIAQDLLSLIYHRYELDGAGASFWRTAQNIPDYGWDIMKYKFATKTLKGNQNFLMVFGGSSVTAGHDNHYRQSYPLVVRKRLIPLFAVMGIKLIVHNFAMGANPCSPYDLCYESMGGSDPDWVGWEQSYNCGHDEGAFEMTARWAGWSRNKGVIYFSASGAWAPDKCKENNVSKTGSLVPFSDENWKESDAGLTKKKFSAEDVHAEKELLNKYNRAHSSASRFMGSWAKDYKGIAPHGFNVWEHNPENKCKKDGKERKDCTAIDAAESMQGDCKMKFMTKEASVYGLGGGRAHHPTAAFHLLRGEAISWLYCMAMLDAIYEMEKDLRTTSKDIILNDYEQKLATLQRPMPSPKKCHRYHCESKPKCYTNYMPHFNKNYLLSDLIVGKTNWSYSGGGNAKGMGIVPNENTLDAIEWQENSVKGTDVTDRKPKWTSKGLKTGEIHIKILIKEKNFIWIFAEAIDKTPFEHAAFFLDINATAALIKNAQNETSYIPSSNRIMWTKVNKMGNEGVHLFDLPNGEHILSILNNYTMNSKKGFTCGLSHVLMW